jgi:hypothetical protein
LLSYLSDSVGSHRTVVSTNLQQAEPNGEDS